MDQTTLNATWQIIIGMSPFIAVITAWGLNEWNKRREERRKNKERIYNALLESSNGFYVSVSDENLKNKFLQELRVAWLYCPDHVIGKCNDFLKKVQVGERHCDTVKEQAMFDFIIAMRKDLHGIKTKLTKEDYRFWHST